MLVCMAPWQHTWQAQKLRAGVGAKGLEGSLPSQSALVIGTEVRLNW